MNTLTRLLRNRKVAKGLGLTVLWLLFIRFWYAVPVFGVSPKFMAARRGQLSMGIYDLLTGGGSTNLSVMSLNITPYINATIIMQLMGVIVPRIKEMQQGMIGERKLIERWTLVLSGVLALLQSITMSLAYQRMGALRPGVLPMVCAIVLWTAGSVACAFIGKHIQDRYQVNGTSLILLMNILSAYPSDLRTLMYTINGRFIDPRRQILAWIVTAALIFFLFLFAYWLQEAEKPVKITYSGRATGRYQSVGTFPIKLCPGSVAPVVFASALLSIPVIVSSFTRRQDVLWVKIFNTRAWFDPRDPLPTVGAFIYLALIFIFSYFYTFMTLDPEQITDTIRKNGGTIDGVRAGRPTEVYLRRQIRSVIGLGSLCLSVIALIPLVAAGLLHTSRLSFLGTSILITVGVITEIGRYVKAQTKSSVYEERIRKQGGIF